MKWNDEGLLLATKPYGENSQIVEVFTSRHGRHLGMVKGMSLKKNIAIFLTFLARERFGDFQARESGCSQLWERHDF